MLELTKLLIHISCLAWQLHISEPAYRIEELYHDPYGKAHLGKTVQVSDSLKMLTRIEVSSKGNGSLEIGSWEIKVFDAHGDLNLFRNYLINIYFIDVNRDGYKDLVMWGIRDIYEDKGEYQYSYPVFGLFVYDPDEADFRPVFPRQEWCWDGLIYWRSERFRRRMGK